jgi:hypothetical protein
MRLSSQVWMLLVVRLPSSCIDASVLVRKGLTLAIVVEQDETSECYGHHEGSSQQDLVAELHVSGH